MSNAIRKTHPPAKGNFYNHPNIGTQHNNIIKQYGITENFQMSSMIRDSQFSDVMHILPDTIKDAGHHVPHPVRETAHGHSGAISGYGHGAHMGSSADDMIKGYRSYGAHTSNLEQLTNMMMGSVFPRKRERFTKKSIRFDTKEPFCHSTTQYSTPQDAYMGAYGKYMYPVR
jgi:hypothetical protein